MTGTSKALAGVRFIGVFRAGCPRGRPFFNPVLRILRLGIPALAAAAAIYAALLPRVTVLIIRDGRGAVLARLDLNDGRFVHRYVHSVNLTDVDEEYSVEKDGMLRLTAARFDTLGVGMPYEAEKGFSREGNRFVLRMDRSFRRIPLRVSPLPGHVVLAGGRAHPLDRWAKAGELVILEAGSIPRLIHIMPLGARE
ncbi:MAG TPA: DUF1850 domain-containing protein [Magnetospirillaceae bacterium]|nr:DUF1850 domain-containing protein [Magnetospirillaceae bacterium]